MKLDKIDNDGTYRLSGITMLCPDCKNKIMVMRKNDIPFMASNSVVVIPTECNQCGYGGILEIFL